VAREAGIKLSLIVGPEKENSHLYGNQEKKRQVKKQADRDAENLGLSIS
jgi:hypothetical protein